MNAYTSFFPVVIPAQAGIQAASPNAAWVPASAGTKEWRRVV